MSDNFTDKALEIAQANGATEAIARLTIGPNHQIRFSNSNIDIFKKWDDSLLEVFIAIGKKTTQVDIQDPTEAKITEMIKKATSITKKMPDSELFAKIDSACPTFPKIAPTKAIRNIKKVHFFIISRYYSK